MDLVYSCLSAWARREWTAGPFDSFNIFDWINVLSIFFPISPPRASSSRTRCPLELPPTFGLHGISAMLSTLTVKMVVESPSLAQASAASHPACPAPTTTTSVYSSNVFISCLHLFAHTELTENFIYQIIIHGLADNPQAVQIRSHLLQKRRSPDVLPLFPSGSVLSLPAPDPIYLKEQSPFCLQIVR